MNFRILTLPQSYYKYARVDEHRESQEVENIGLASASEDQHIIDEPLRKLQEQVLGTFVFCQRRNSTLPGGRTAMYDEAQDQLSCRQRGGALTKRREILSIEYISVEGIAVEGSKLQ